MKVLAGVTIVLLGVAEAQQPAAPPLVVSVRVDATKVANRIGPQLYGHFLEFMFEGIKFGLHAELLANRGFEDGPGGAGLPREWAREPNSRMLSALPGRERHRA